MAVHLCIQTYCTVDLSLVDDLHRRRERRRREVADAIHNYKDEGRPFETHNSLTPWSWSVLSYPIAPTVWFLYYREMDRILRTLTDENTLYIHGFVFVPFNTTLHDPLRMTVYRLFYFNTPASLWHVVRTIRFRLLFIAPTSFGDQVRIERLRVSTDPSTTLYPGGLLCESWRDIFFRKKQL